MLDDSFRDALLRSASWQPFPQGSLTPEAPISGPVTPAGLRMLYLLLSFPLLLRKGCDVDQPINLAKSVTVE